MALKKILAVDDEEYNLEIISEILEDLPFELKTVSSGPECLAVVETFAPELILLDVSMPDMSGYEVCQQLKSNPATKDIVVMFVSARGTVEERMEGYAAGAEDYIVKPFGHDELRAKLVNLNQFMIDKETLQEQLDEATATAFNAMANSSEMGQVVNYVEQIGAIWDPNVLGRTLLHSLQGFGLQANVEFRLPAERLHFSTAGSCSPIVIELFELLKSRGRLHEFSQRILVNYDLVSLLVLNMPEEDQEKLGRFRDHICFLISVTEQQLKAIITQSSLERQRRALSDATALIEHKAKALMDLLNQNRRENEAIFKALQEEFEMRIPTMGLDEDQELFIYRKVDETIQKSVAREDALQSVEQAFNEISEELARLQKA